MKEVSGSGFWSATSCRDGYEVPPTKYKHSTFSDPMGAVNAKGIAFLLVEKIIHIPFAGQR